jgi:hypothetical protein
MRSKMVLYGASDDGTPVLTVCVDGKYPQRWREFPYLGQLREISLAGLRRTPKQLTVVFAGDHKYLVLGDNVVVDPPSNGSLASSGPDRWQFIGQDGAVWCE